MVEKPVLNNKGRVTGQKEIRPVWHNAQRVNHQNKLTHPHPKRNFVPTAVATKSRQVPVNAAKQSSPRAAASVSTAMPVNTAAPKPKVNDALPTTYSYFKAHSPVRRAFNKKSAAKTNNFNEKVNTGRVNNVTTAGPKTVVSAAEGNEENAIKHMTGNKSFLTDYQEIDGGFVAFGRSPKGGKITRKGKIRTGKLDFEDVYFVKELKFNLFFVSQMCDKKNNVLFIETKCIVLSHDFKLLDESQVLLKVPIHDNMYSFDIKNVLPSGSLTCLFTKATIDESNLWHRRLGHINFKTMNKLVRGNLVRGLPSKLFENDHTCVACQKGKQHKASCKTKLVSSISQPLQMLHMDLFGPTSVRSINHKTYCLVVTDDYSRFSWVFFLATKDETSGILKTFITGIENQINHKVKIIRCDNGTEFKNNDMNQFCGMKRIKREFSVARTLQQNGVAERKNRTLIEAARTMLADSLLPTTFWAEAVNTACYVQNRVLVTKPHNKTPYELLHGRPPSISFMRPFGFPVTILNTLNPLGKFDGKADEGFLVRYSINSKAFRVFNTRTRKVEENLHITFLENKPNVAGSGPDWLFDIDLLTNSMNYEPVTAGNQTNRNAGIKDNVDAVPTQQYILLPLLYDSPQSSEDAVADDAGKKTNEEPANEGERNGQEKEGGASNKEGDQNVQDFRAELDNLLVQQKEGYANSTNRVSTVSPSVSAVGQSFDNADDLPTDPLMPDLEDTADLLNTGIFSGAYDDKDEGAEADLNNLETTMNVSKDQIIRDINSATQTRRMTKISEEHALNPRRFTLQEEGIDYDEVFALVARIEAISFEDSQFPNKVYKGKKSLIGLHQAPRAWYKTLSTYLLENGFRRGIIDKTLFIKKDKGNILLVPGVMQRNDGIFISQDKYVADILKKFDFATIKTTSTPIETNKALLKDEEVGVIMLEQALIGNPQQEVVNFLAKGRFHGNVKKQTIVANTTTKVEYVADANCYRQNPVFHAKTKNIEIRHHFISDSYGEEAHSNSISNEFRVKTGGCKVNAARQDLVLLGES
ncbi:putative ribonuclease H-like domain-containing protein [Tanacetum coccineum]